MSDTINYPLLKEMIDCVAREVALRFAVYPKRVQIGKMTKEQADREIMLMQMIRNSLKKVYDKKAPQAVQQAFLILKILTANLKSIGGKVKKLFYATKLHEENFMKLF